MALSKKQLTYGGVLVVAAGAFLWDRCTSAPAPAEAATAAALVKPVDLATPVAPRGPASAAQHALGNRAAMGTRLSTLASARGVAPGKSLDAFEVSSEWAPKKAAAVEGKSNAQVELDAARDFAARHVLNAVMVKSNGGYAILDGQGVFVGNVINKYKLVQVTKTSALFTRDAVRVELHLDAKPKVWREPTVIGGAQGDNAGAARVE